MSALFARKPRRNQKIPADLKHRVERLLALPDEGGHHALTIVARELHGLYIIDRDWSRTVLLPQFDAAKPAAEAAWSGFLSATQMPSPALFAELKHAFLQAIAATPHWTCHGLTLLAEVLVLALDWPKRGRPLVMATEARNALRGASSAVREHALFFLRSCIGQTGAWDRLIVPFFRNVWPRERKFQTEATTRCLVLFLEELGAHFPLGVALVANFLVPSANTDTFIYKFGSNRQLGHADLTGQFPQETLSLLSRIVDQTRPHPPYGLADAMTRLAEASPELRHDERWQQLHRLTLV